MINESCANPCISCNPPIGGAAGLGLNPLDPNYPFVNLSSEAPDVDLFISRRGSGLGLPPLGSTWYSVGCLGFCFSSVSQDDADVCAAQQAALCVVPNWPVMIPNPNPGPEEPEFIPQDRQLFYNFQQSAQFTCPDGAVFTYFVPAGTFSALNQEAADAWAASYAEIKAIQNYICIGAMESSRTCIGGQYDSVIVVLAGNKPVGAAITSGALPPGITLQPGPNPNQPSFIISGIATAGGNYPFSITITDSQGNTSVRSYVIDVFGLSDSSQLPDPEVGVAYSYFLTLDGTAAGTVLFSIVGGSLPPGLALNPTTGEIDGTPTEEGAFQVTVQVSDGDLSCDNQFDIFVQPPESTCAVPSDLVWGNQVSTINGDGNIAYSFSGRGGSFSGSASAYNMFDPANSAELQADTSFPFSAAFDLHISGSYSLVSGNGNSGISITIWDGDAGTGIFIGTLFVTPNSVLSPFNEMFSIPEPVNGYLTLDSSFAIYGTGLDATDPPTIFSLDFELGCE